MKTVKVKQNDTARSLEAQLLFKGLAIDLTGATVYVLIKKLNASTGVRKPAVIVDSFLGLVEYALQEDDTAVAGNYYVEWEIIFSDGSVLTVPDDSYLMLVIIADLG